MKLTQRRVTSADVAHKYRQTVATANYDDAVFQRTCPRTHTHTSIQYSA